MSLIWTLQGDCANLIADNHFGVAKKYVHMLIDPTGSTNVDMDHKYRQEIVLGLGGQVLLGDSFSLRCNRYNFSFSYLYILFNVFLFLAVKHAYIHT